MCSQKNILITGGSGFLGVHLLTALLKNQTVETIFVLDRHLSPTASPQPPTRLLNQLRHYQLPVARLYEKVRLIYGDIRQPRLGISHDLYQQLTSLIDVVYHLAAEVNHTQSLEALYPANVASVAAVLEFAAGGKPKIINFASTMGAAKQQDEAGIFQECLPQHTQYPVSNMGYLQSKYEAEKLLLQCEHVNVFRLGYLAASHQTTVPLYAKNQLMLFIKSCLQMGYAPKLDRLFNLTAVDFAAEIMAHPHFWTANGPQVMHLVNHDALISWSQIMAYLQRMGYALTEIEMSLWQQKLKQAGRKNALFPMLLLYRKKDAQQQILQFGKHIHQYSFHQIEQFCQQHHIQYPKVDFDYVCRMFEYLESVGFFPQRDDKKKKFEEKEAALCSVA